MSQLEVDKIVPQSGTTLTIGDSGDTINFADGQNISIDTNTLYIDSTNNRVGIGTTSPSTKLHVYSGNSGVTPNGNADDLFIENNGAAGITIGSSVNEKGNIFFADSGNALDGYIQYAHDTRYLRFATATLERMRIDSSGNVGIGTSSPDRPLTVKEVSNVAISVIKSSGQDILHIGEYGGGGEATYNSILNGSHIFLDNGTEHMRIDSSGNVLVGTTNSTPGVGNTDTGISLRNNNGGSLAVSRSGDRAAYFNRNTSDGDIVQFRKDGTAVGSIGIVNTNNLFIQGDSTNSGLQCGTNTILPVQNGANASNTIDMGDGANLWKDIYLGGGLYVGGTGTANKLDDYEEGTWTPTSFSSGYTASSASGTYTKIGDTVFIRALLNFSAVNGSSNSKCNFDGLPFSASDPTSGVSREDSVTGAIFVVRLGSGTGGEINSMDGISNGSNSVLATGRNYRISGFYKV